MPINQRRESANRTNCISSEGITVILKACQYHFPFTGESLQTTKMFRIIYLVFYSTVQKRQAHLSSTSVPRFTCLMALIRYLVNFTFKILFFFSWSF